MARFTRLLWGRRSSRSIEMIFAVRRSPRRWQRFARNCWGKDTAPLTARASYQIVGESCQSLQSRDGSNTAFPLATVRDIKSFPESVPFRLTDLNRSEWANTEGASVQIADDVYQKNKAFWDSIRETDIYRQGNYLYTGMKVDYGSPLPPIEI